MPSSRRGEDAPRRRQILEALAGELERSPERRITTARLADLVGVSEAALYRHFSSKAGMFESLLEFAEDAVFSAVAGILRDHSDPRERCRLITALLLLFAERNPGITRVLLGDVLMGEGPELRARADRFFDRLETQLRQVLREANLSPQADGIIDGARLSASASLMIASVEGRMRRGLRAGGVPAAADWDAHWEMLARGIFS